MELEQEKNPEPQSQFIPTNTFFQNLLQKENSYPLNFQRSSGNFVEQIKGEYQTIQGVQIKEIQQKQIRQPSSQDDLKIFTNLHLGENQNLIIDDLIDSSNTQENNEVVRDIKDVNKSSAINEINNDQKETNLKLSSQQSQESLPDIADFQQRDKEGSMPNITSISQNESQLSTLQQKNGQIHQLRQSDVPSSYRNMDPNNQNNFLDIPSNINNINSNIGSELDRSFNNEEIEEEIKVGTQNNGENGILMSRSNANPENMQNNNDASQNIDLENNINRNISNINSIGQQPPIEEQSGPVQVLGAQNNNEQQNDNFGNVLFYLLYMDFFKAEFIRRRSMLRNIILNKIYLLVFEGIMIYILFSALGQDDKCDGKFDILIILIIIFEAMTCLIQFINITYICLTDYQILREGILTGQYADCLTRLKFFNYDDIRSLNFQISSSPYIRAPRILNNFFYAITMMYANYVFYLFGFEQSCSMEGAGFKWTLILVYLIFFYLLTALLIFVLLVRCIHGPIEDNHNGIPLARRTNQVGATTEQLIQLPVEKLSHLLEDDNTECAICLQEFQIGVEIIRLKCSAKHFFHKDCAFEWLKVQSLCPLCKGKIFQNPPEPNSQINQIPPNNPPAPVQNIQINQNLEQGPADNSIPNAP